VIPSSINARAGVSVPLTVNAVRRDGFSNEISMLLKDAPPGMFLSGARIPANQDRVRLTLCPPAVPETNIFSISLEGRALINGKEVRRAAIPAEDMMQAFAYHHLVPAEELLVAISGRQFLRTPARLLTEAPVKILLGGSVKVPIKLPPGMMTDRFQFELSEPPDGISLTRNSLTRESELEVKCDRLKAKAGAEGNLIVNIIAANSFSQSEKGKKTVNQRRTTIGVLPAISFQIVGEQEVTAKND
jgi:hypothetical protein